MTQGTQTGALWQSLGWGGRWEAGWGEGFGRERTWECLWLILADVWQKTTKFCKAIILQLIKWGEKKKKICLSLQETQETKFRSLGLEDPLEKGMASHSSILAWRIPWTEESGRLQSMGSQRVAHGWAHMHDHKLILMNQLNKTLEFSERTASKSFFFF